MKFSGYLSGLKAVYAELDLSVPLRSPAQMKAVQALERACGIRLPAELRAAWKATNGTGDATFFARPGYLTGYGFLSVADALKEREGLRRRAPKYAGYVEPEPRGSRVRPGWFQPGWLPFAGFGGATLLLLLDFTPAPRGRAGQVLALTHDPDQIEYVAPSFDRFLAESLAAIEADPDELLQEL